MPTSKQKAVFLAVLSDSVKIKGSRVKYHGVSGHSTPDFGKEDKNMKNENRNEEAVSPVIATILMVAITVVLAGVLYVWASSLAEGNTGDSAVFYDFTADGAIEGQPSTATDDSLVRMTMNQGQAINWAAVSVSVSINDGAPITCDKDSGDRECVYVDFGSDTSDQEWGVGEGITISEQNTQLCDGSEPCKVDITITDTQAGKTIDTSSAISS